MSSHTPFPFPPGSSEEKAERIYWENKAKEEKESLRRSPFHQELSSAAIELVTRHAGIPVEELQYKLDFLENYLLKVSGKD